MVWYLLAALVTLIGGGVLLLQSRNLHIWLFPWIAQRWLRGIQPDSGQDIHVYFCFADHYEPYEGGDDAEEAKRRVRYWIQQYPEVAKRHQDSFGVHPQHSFFYPEEEYDPELLDMLAQLCRQGWGDVEIHLHHENDSAERLLGLLRNYKETLFHRHGLLRKDAATGDILFAFIHGNWALDNSARGGRHCGVDNELQVLAEAGCVADLTMPSAPHETQSSIVNSLCAIKGFPGKRKSFDRGRRLSVGDELVPGELLMVQGPLTLNWRQRKLGLLPKIENGEISWDAPPSDQRAALWESCGVCLDGAENHLFIKVHTHGAQNNAMRMLFDQHGFDQLWTVLEKRFRDREGYQLHYVTAWEMVTKIKELMKPA